MQFHEANTLYAYDIPKKTQQDLLEEKEYNDFKNNVGFNNRGLPGYLLTGHGCTLEDFQKRDLATTNFLSYENKMKASEITSTREFRNDNAHLLQYKPPKK